MAAELESSLEQFFRKRVRLLGGYTIKLAPTERGVPDRLVIMPGGRMFLVELKRDGEDPSPIQKVWHARIAEYGVRVHVVRGREGILRWLRVVVAALDPDRRTNRRAPKRVS